MFSKSEIMKAAWQSCRRTWSYCRPTRAADRRKAFAHALAAAWAHAKYAIADALKTNAQKAAERVNALKAHLMRLDASPFGMRICKERSAVLVEIKALEMETL
ncbi:hypothetical protein [Pararhizobium sp.]|uniref:hypothetical protein n=1 Tax=Pararhizobium sp. TaxID=1977563 RepID=UPI0027165F0D|nr:hypothetical protein [Pararhizobium sp.]MDO9416221.1 hypothetical protein [Pararhizobium sp.]